MPNENTRLKGTYKYFFNVSTPNAHNATGPILSVPYYLFTYPPEDSRQPVWRPSPPVYKAKEGVLAYQQFVKSKGFYCLILIEVVDLNTINDIPDLFDFHRQIDQVNKNECDRWLQWLHTTNPKLATSMDFRDAVYIVGENLSIFKSFPYAVYSKNPIMISGTKS